MTLHVCRDFLSIGNPFNISTPAYLMYYQAIFLRAILGYTVVGQTSFNIDGATYFKAAGAAGSLNQGGIEYTAFIPNGYVVSAADVNRILAIKSNLHPMQNSGLFRVVAVDTSTNYLYINYRSGEPPPAESGLSWRLYENEVPFAQSLTNTGNGIAGTYQSRGSALTNRIILQSPSSLNWQVRIAYEASVDTGFISTEGGVGPHWQGTSPQTGFTTMPGYGGDAAGDFPVGGQHLHWPMWINVRNINNYATSVGLFTNTAVQSRFYAWGDDVTGTCFMVGRNVAGSGGTDGMIHFGTAEDEEQPLPPKNVQRLFVMGTAHVAGGIGWSSGTESTGRRSGMGFGLSNQPISCIYSLYNPMVDIGWPGGGVATHRNNNFAGDNPYLAATELLPVDLLVGTHDVQVSVGGTLPEILNLEGRRLGRAPIIRMGRGNYGYFQISADTSGNGWIHLNDGMFAPWKGAILP